MSSSISAGPDFSVERDGANVRIALRGAWTIAGSRALEKAAEALGAAGKGARERRHRFRRAWPGSTPPAPG